MSDDPSYQRELANALCLFGIRLGEMSAKIDYAIEILRRLDEANTGTTKGKARKRHAAARSTAAGDIAGNKP